MKKLIKFFSLIGLFLLGLGLAGCGETSTNNSGDSGSGSTDTPPTNDVVDPEVDPTWKLSDNIEVYKQSSQYVADQVEGVETPEKSAKLSVKRSGGPVKLSARKLSSTTEASILEKLSDSDVIITKYGMCTLQSLKQRKDDYSYFLRASALPIIATTVNSKGILDQKFTVRQIGIPRTYEYFYNFLLEYYHDNNEQLISGRCIGNDLKYNASFYMSENESGTTSEIYSDIRADFNLEVNGKNYQSSELLGPIYTKYEYTNDKNYTINTIDIDENFITCVTIIVKESEIESINIIKYNIPGNAININNDSTLDSVEGINGFHIVKNDNSYNIYDSSVSNTTTNEYLNDLFVRVKEEYEKYKTYLVNNSESYNYGSITDKIIIPIFSDFNSRLFLYSDDTEDVLDQMFFYGDYGYRVMEVVADMVLFDVVKEYNYDIELYKTQINKFDKMKQQWCMNTDGRFLIQGAPLVDICHDIFYKFENIDDLRSPIEVYREYYLVYDKMFYAHNDNIIADKTILLDMQMNGYYNIGMKDTINLTKIMLENVTLHKTSTEERNTLINELISSMPEGSYVHAFPGFTDWHFKYYISVSGDRYYIDPNTMWNYLLESGYVSSENKYDESNNVIVDGFGPVKENIILNEKAINDFFELLDSVADSGFTFDLTGVHVMPYKVEESENSNNYKVIYRFIVSNDKVFYNLNSTVNFIEFTGEEDYKFEENLKVKDNIYFKGNLYPTHLEVNNEVGSYIEFTVPEGIESLTLECMGSDLLYLLDANGTRIESANFRSTTGIYMERVYIVFPASIFTAGETYKIISASNESEVLDIYFTYPEEDTDTPVEDNSIKLDFSTLSGSTLSASVELGIFAINATEEKYVEVYDSLIDLKGTGNAEYRSISLNLQKAAVITIEFFANAADRPLTLFDASGNKVASNQTLDGGETDKVEINVSVGVYYFASEDGGIKINSISVKYVEE